MGRCVSPCLVFSDYLLLVSFSKKLYSILYNLQMEHISDTCCHVFLVKLTSCLSYQTKRFIQNVSFKSSQKAPLVAFPARNSDRFCNPADPAMQENLMLWVIQPFKHVFCVLVVVVWSYWVLGMVFIRSIQMTDHDNPTQNSTVCMMPHSLVQCPFSPHLPCDVIHR